MHTDIPEFPDAPLARLAVDLVTAEESPATAHHSLRSALFARMLADHRGAEPGRDYDPLLLFLACALHDIGLSEAGNRGQRFEVDGADTAAEFLTRQGMPAAEVDAVWEAIALHTSPGIAERRGVLPELVRTGIGVDFGFGAGFLTDAAAGAVHARYPRLDMATVLTDEIVSQVRARPEKAPPYSLPAELLRERATPPHRSLLEVAEQAHWAH